ncbi:MAG TPA: hypothetical protein VLD39_06795 [Gammaproteobacteria bacterium]|nr:hypothetical protein [Gammaproteobacteria bacterium]
MFRRLFTLLVVVLVLGAVAWYRPEARDLLRSLGDRWTVLRKDGAAAQELGPAASAELADQAQRKLDRVQSGNGHESFTTAELQSLLQFRYRQLLPEYVGSPRVTLEGDHIAIRLRVPIERLPRVSDFGEILALLPDTTDLDIRGTLLPSDEGHVAFAVDAVSAQRIPLPRRLVPSALELLGRQDRPGLPEDAIVVPLPSGARSAYVRGDSLVLLSAGAGTRD